MGIEAAGIRLLSQGRYGTAHLCHSPWSALCAGTRSAQYHDALFVKRNTVVPFIVEATFGGITPRARAYMRHLARTATRAGATDRTVYGRARPSTRDFLTHHTRRIVKATVVSGATTICEQVINLKQRACALAGEAAA